MSWVIKIHNDFNEANKWLCLISIIFILVINGLLIYKHVRKPKFYHSPKNMIMLSMAIADVMLAMFPLIVQAKFSFEPNSREDIRDSCRLMVTYETYKFYLVHFVYGVGLVTLGAEILIRHRWKYLLYRPGPALIAGCIPWLLGLIVVLPLCMTDMDYEYCMKTLYSRWMSIGSYFIPAGLALVLSVLIPFITRQPRGIYGYVMTPTVARQQNVSSPTMHQGDSNPVGFLNQPNQDSSCQQAISHQTEVQPGNDASHQSGNFSYKSGSVSSKEKVRLAVVTLFFIEMVTPFQTVATLNWLTFFADFYYPNILTVVTSWLMVARSYVTPLIMFFFIVRQTW